MKTYKDVEIAREKRLWIRDVIMPSVIGGVLLYNIPEVKHWCKDKICKIKAKFKRS